MLKLFWGILILSCILYSCKPTVTLLKGEHKPAVENQSSIEKYLNKNQVPYNQLAISSFNKFVDNIISIGNNTALIFDSKGRALTVPGFNKGCSPDVANMLALLDTSSKYTVSNLLTLDSIALGFLEPNGENFIAKIPSDVDFTVVISWSKWAGKKVFYRDARACINAVANNKNALFHIILLNLDKQEIWGENNLSRLIMTSGRIEILPE